MDVSTTSVREVEKGEEPGVISLTVPGTNSQPDSEAEKGEEPKVISLTVPGKNLQTGKEAEKVEEAVISLEVNSWTVDKEVTSETVKEAGTRSLLATNTRPDYMRTTWNSVTGYETSV